MSNQFKGLKENFAHFFESPSRETLRELLRDNTGEDDDLDFKIEITTDQELAKDILGMANKLGTNFSNPNPHYPQEYFEAFISRMISVKKEVIEDFIRKKR
ncbi:MAG: hypothetical protein QNJ36_08475 [Calothrix sp. MO_167.B42]|nr:hypothetical protein [Calothrix sp. MO_167.B42]